MREKSETLTSTSKIVIVLALIACISIPLAHFLPTAQKIAPGDYEKRVCAFYYTWYGNTTAYPGENPSTNTTLLHWQENGHDPISDPWNISSAQHPTLDSGDILIYDSGDPYAIRYHLDMATYAGIDTFICTWWGQNGYEDYNFRQVLDITETDGYDMQHTVYFETVQDRFRENESGCVDELYDDLSYIYDNYGNHSKFLNIYDEQLGRNRPVIFVYSTFARPSVANWTTVVNRLHENDKYPFLIADLGGPKAVPSDYVGLFDGIHVYNPLGLYRDEPEAALQKFETMTLSGRFHGMLTCVTTLPGYNDTQVRDGVTALPRENGEIYKESWDVANAVNPDWALICTFNEWHEGTEIEPSWENGTYYINATKEYIRQFK